ncbi:MAG TPA: serine protease [Thermoanaerobaculia bacterium]|nr:serine protease [Thermoanaerobaculia bacterium]
MRIFSAGALFTLFCVSLSATPMVAPRLAVETAETELFERPLLDRTTARELARFTATPRPPRLVANLRQEASVETLARPVELLPASELGKISVDGAATLRLRIEANAPGTVLWLAGEDDEELERFEPGQLATWGPTTRGATVFIQVERGAVASVTAFAAGAPQTNSSGATCLKDVACAATEELPELADASRAIAMIRFVRGDASYVCTGALLNDAAHSGIPYFLTARHCISTAAEAASIEAVWDERSDSCGNPGAKRKSTRTYGAQLLAASPETDVALLRLDRIPPNRVFLGVTLEPLTDGAPTYRLSHAGGLPQTYSAGVVRADGPGCTSAPRSHFIYTSASTGTVTTGSSGAPLLLPGLRVAGQLLGMCGPSPNDACAIYNDAVDGSIAASWPLLAPFLDPPVTSRRRSARH